MSSLHSPKSRGRRAAAPPTPVYQPSQEELDALALILVIRLEGRQAFLDLLMANIARYRPADVVEYGLVEEITAYNWRTRRNWAIETFLLNAQSNRQPTPGDSAYQQIHTIATASEICASHSSTSVLQRQEARLHVMFQRALRTLILLRKEFPLPPQPAAAPPAPLLVVPPKVATEHSPAP